MQLLKNEKNCLKEKEKIVNIYYENLLKFDEESSIITNENC